MLRCLILLLLVLGLTCGNLVTPPLEGREAPKKQAGPSAKEKTAATWTVEDVLLGEYASAFRISPDGRSAVWVKHVLDKDKGVFVTHLMRSGLTEEVEVQLTRGPHACSNPQWSPDGKLLAFLTARPTPKDKAAGDEDEDKDEPKTQVWLLNPFGGEPWVLTDAPRGVRGFAWTDAHTLLYFAQEEMTLREKRLEKKKDTTQVIDDEANEPPIRLWSFAMATKKAERLTENKDRIQTLAVSPDGHHALTIHERSLSYTFDHKVKPVVFLHDLRKGTHKQLFSDRRWHAAEVHWRLASEGFYVVSSFTRHPQYLMAYVNEVHHYDFAGETLRKVDLGWDKGLAHTEDSFAVTPDGFVALLADGVKYRGARYTQQADVWKRQVFDRDHLQGLAAGKDGKTLLFQESSCQQPPRWFRCRLEGNQLREEKVLTDLQGDLRQRQRAKTEVVRWQGGLDQETEGILYYPHGWTEGQKAPLVVLIHGGPFGVVVDEWDENWADVPNLLCARGAFVFRPNYHGSSNYGLDWAESIANGKYYQLPVVDIEKGIDALVRRGLVDPGKVGLSGWSNGAILTMALITRRHYQAAAAGAGGSEWVGDWGACEFGMAFSNYYLGKSPLEDPELYRKNAPFFDFPKVRTPTLLFQGAEDRVVPVHHGWMQFRALQQLGKAEVRYLLFPGEKHSLKKLPHRRRKVEEELAWFDRHLFRTAKDVNPSLKEDSPLAVALALKQAARQGQRYGVLKNDVLVPETVLYKGHQLGRFEVTRAQYAKFNPKFRVAPGTDNYPAGGITFTQAQGYCAWLSKLTGTTYRVGRVEEMTEVYEVESKAENTLDMWAGYAVNPEDRERLQAKIRELGGTAPLLKEVGSGGSAGVFDLGGNVAEWAEDEQGKGCPLGGSADRSAGDHQPPSAEYIGLRVMLEIGPPQKKKR